MLRGLYHRLLALSASRRAPVWLALVAFAESSFFPVPPDALLIPMVLARPRRAWVLALICTMCSVLGGCLGYFIGAELFQLAAMPLLRLYHYQDRYEQFRTAAAGVWLRAILIKGLLPIPYKIVTIISGAIHFDFLTFLWASALTRGGRFFLEAALLRAYGDAARHRGGRRYFSGSRAVAGGMRVPTVSARSATVPPDRKPLRV
jgi:membrane protein YqaA with SNARE-associated domain